MRTRKIVITPALWAEAERIRREQQPSGNYNIVSSCVVSQAVRKQWRKGRPRANRDGFGYKELNYNPIDSRNAARLRAIVDVFDMHCPYPFGVESVTVEVKR